ncbi:hypothetical protein [Listeria portnoyi]|uniref:hypothetical protein n=1 Tax=Listeria portnoyi TaxID=2713504 RepID=UPI001FE27E98|nr:hypothetical protein [Listeria portnoyi]
MEIVSGKILRIAHLKGVSFSDQKFVPNYLARLILGLGLELGGSEETYSNARVMALILESMRIFT